MTLTTWELFRIKADMLDIFVEMLENSPNYDHPNAGWWKDEMRRRAQNLRGNADRLQRDYARGPDIVRENADRKWHAGD